MKLKKPKFSVRFAVFNQHINNAGKRAYAVVNKMYEETDPDLIQLNKDYKNGIMNIYNRPLNSVSRVYEALVFYFVNYGKEK